MDEDNLLEDSENVVPDSATDNLDTTTSQDGLGTEINNNSTGSTLDDDEQINSDSSDGTANNDSSDGTVNNDGFDGTANNDNSDGTANSDVSDDTNKGDDSTTVNDLLNDLFTTNSVLGSYLNTDGYVIVQDGSIYSDFIFVNADSIYNLFNLTDSVYNSACFYDSNYTFISAIDSDLSSFTTPAGCSYLIISCDAAIAEDVILEQQSQEELTTDEELLTEESVTEEPVIQVTETVDYTLLIEDMQLSIDLLNENLQILTSQYVQLDEESQELVPVTVFNKKLDDFTVTETLLAFIVFFNLVQIARNIFRKRRNF